MRCFEGTAGAFAFIWAWHGWVLELVATFASLRSVLSACLSSHMSSRMHEALFCSFGLRCDAGVAELRVLHRLQLEAVRSLAVRRFELQLQQLLNNRSDLQKQPENIYELTKWG